jgi:alkylation response protein AidB-like acyl-CoA dehydrogenase
LDDLLADIRGRADAVDVAGAWPADDLAALAAAGAMRWAVPGSHGGDGLSPIDLHLRYERLAAASLTVALILTQRDSAVGFMAGAENAGLRDELLPRLARAGLFATVGVAQLTTSRQGGTPALRATRAGDGWRLDGYIPWSTGAARAEVVVAGAVTEDRRQLLFVLPTDLPGVRVGEPMPLVALRASLTGEVRLDGVTLADRWVLRGPVENAMAGRYKGVPVGQAFLAMGLCRAGLDLIGAHRSETAAEAHERLGAQLAGVRSEVLALCDPASAPADMPRAAAEVRGTVNDLALRITHAAVALYKGTALLAGHPAQRLAREAMFLLVWSCPNPVIDCTVDLLSEGR